MFSNIPRGTQLHRFQQKKKKRENEEPTTSVALTRSLEGTSSRVHFKRNFLITMHYLFIIFNAVSKSIAL